MQEDALFSLCPLKERNINSNHRKSLFFYSGENVLFLLWYIGINIEEFWANPIHTFRAKCLKNRNLKIVFLSQKKKIEDRTEEGQTWVSNGGPDGVATKEQKLDNPRRYVSGSSGDTDDLPCDVHLSVIIISGYEFEQQLP